MSPGGLVVVVAAVAAVVVGSAGCPSRAGDANDLAVASDADARAVARRLIADLEAGDGDVVGARFCDQHPDARARADAIVAPALSVKTLEVRRVEPAWRGATPYFYVEIGDSIAQEGAWVHGFGVDVRTGCLERAVGEADVGEGHVGERDVGERDVGERDGGEADGDRGQAGGDVDVERGAMP